MTVGALVLVVSALAFAALRSDTVVVTHVEQGPLRQAVVASGRVRTPEAGGVGLLSIDGGGEETSLVCGRFDVERAPLGDDERADCAVPRATRERGLLHEHWEPSFRVRPARLRKSRLQVVGAHRTGGGIANGLDAVRCLVPGLGAAVLRRSACAPMHSSANSLAHEALSGWGPLATRAV